MLKWNGMRCPALKKNVSHSLQSSPIVLPIHTRHLRGCLSLMSSVNKTKVPSVQLAPFCFHPVEIHKKKINSWFQKSKICWKSAPSFGARIFLGGRSIFLQKIFVCWDPHSFPSSFLWCSGNRVSQPVCPSLPQQDSWEPHGPPSGSLISSGSGTKKTHKKFSLRDTIRILTSPRFWKAKFAYGTEEYQNLKERKPKKKHDSPKRVLESWWICSYFYLDFPWNHGFLDSKNYPSLWVVIHHVTAVIHPRTSNPIPQDFLVVTNMQFSEITRVYPPSWNGIMALSS